LNAMDDVLLLVPRMPGQVYTAAAAA